MIINILRCSGPFRKKKMSKKQKWRSSIIGETRPLWIISSLKTTVHKWFLINISNETCNIKSHVYFDMIWNILKDRCVLLKFTFWRKGIIIYLQHVFRNAYCDICNLSIIKSARILAVASTRVDQIILIKLTNIAYGSIITFFFYFGS